MTTTGAVAGAVGATGSVVGPTFCVVVAPGLYVVVGAVTGGFNTVGVVVVTGGFNAVSVVVVVVGFNTAVVVVVVGFNAVVDGTNGAVMPSVLM